MPNDELFRTLVNRGGKLVEQEVPLPPSSPSHIQVPRIHGKDFVNAVMARPDEGMLSQAVKGATIIGAGIPLTLFDLLLDQYSPQMKAQDVNLPSRGPIDPRILKKSGF